MLEGSSCRWEPCLVFLLLLLFCSLVSDLELSSRSSGTSKVMLAAGHGVGDGLPSQEQRPLFLA